MTDRRREHNLIPHVVTGSVGPSLTRKNNRIIVPN